MIVQCSECSTKFRLDDSKVSDAGVKVRCAKCRHIFVVRREAPVEEPVDSGLPEFGGEEPSASLAAGTDGAKPAGPSIEMDDDLFRSIAATGQEQEEEGFAESSFNETPQAVEANADAGGGQEFHFDTSTPLPGGADPDAADSLRFEPPSFQEFSFDSEDVPLGADAPETAAPPSLPDFAPQEEPGSDFSFGEAASSDEDFSFQISAPEPAASPAGDELPSFSFEPFPEPPPADDASPESFDVPLPNPLEDSFTFASQEDNSAAGAPSSESEAEQGGAFADVGDFSFDVPSTPSGAATPAQAAAKDDPFDSFLGEPVPSSSQSGPLVFGDTEDLTGGDDDLPPLSIPSRKKSGSSGLLWGGIVILLLLVAGGGGWWYVQQNGIASLEPLLAAVGVDTSPRYELTGVTGVYATAADGAELFVVNGEVKNLSRFPRAEIQLRATLYGPGNKALSKKLAFGGNPIIVARLGSLPVGGIEKIMANRFGDGLSNIEVKEGQSLPFTVVFASPPAEAVDFGVEVASSALAQPKK